MSIPRLEFGYVYAFLSSAVTKIKTGTVTLYYFTPFQSR